MPLDFTPLKNAPRLLMEATLQPVQGSRFQPTGFPDLGAAEYDGPDGHRMLLVESAQSMANHLEKVCWDDAADELRSTLKGLPYIKVVLGDGLGTTASLLEFHRLNSPYICDATTADKKLFLDILTEAVGLKHSRKTKEERSEAKREGESEDVAGVVDFRKLAKAVFRYDPNSLIHGIFLEKVAGRLRLARALSGFIEAREVSPATSGGVKFDRVDPTGDAKEGRGHVPFHRVEYTAKEIKAFFNLDLAQVHGYGLGEAAENLLIALSLWKVRRCLESGLRLRTACDLDLVNPEAFKATRPAGYKIPDTELLTAELPGLIDRCKGQFVSPAITQLQYDLLKKKSSKKKDKAAPDALEGKE